MSFNRLCIWQFLGLLSLSTLSMAASVEAPLRPFAVYLGDLKLRIPKSYDFPRSGPDTISEDIHLTEIGLAFWMPDLAAPEANAFFSVSRRPAETNRPHPKVSEYLVTVRSLSRTDVRLANGWPLPETRIDNVKRWLVSYDLVADRGLTRFVPTGAWKLPKATWFSLSDPMTHFIMDCFLEGEVPNPGCRVNLQFRDLDLLASLDIPTDARYEMPRVADAIRMLIGKWNEKL